MEFFDVVTIERRFYGLEPDKLAALLGAYGIVLDIPSSVELSSIKEDADDEGGLRGTYTATIKASKWVYSGDGPTKTLEAAKKDLYEVLDKVAKTLS